MIKIDMWYGDKPETAEYVDVYFYGNESVYRGNIYKGGRMVGDYVCDDSLELEKAFPQVIFNWD